MGELESLLLATTALLMLVFGLLFLVPAARSCWHFGLSFWLRLLALPLVTNLILRWLDEFAVSPTYRVREYGA